ncbi:hypothetical protein MHYP_G00250750 [Metynnis hypsauchen]
MYSSLKTESEIAEIKDILTSEDSDDDEPCCHQWSVDLPEGQQAVGLGWISWTWTSSLLQQGMSRLPHPSLPPRISICLEAPCYGRVLALVRESVLTDLSEQPEPPLPVLAQFASICSSGTSGANEDSLSEGLPSPLEHGSFQFEAKTISGSSGGSKSTRSRARSFLKRMESLRLRSSSTTSKRKKKGTAGQGRLEISGPVLKEGFDEDKLRQLNCVDISTLDCNGNRNRSISYSTQTSSGSTGSSQSETSSGSAVSTPSPVTRARSHSTAAGSAKRAGCTWKGLTPLA